MCVVRHPYMLSTKAQTKPECLADVQRSLRPQTEPGACRPRLYPSFRRGPRIGPNCPACLTGVKHPGSVLYGREKGRRFSAYVPEELVPQVQRWLDQLLSGRANERVVSALGGRVVRSHF